MLCDIGYGINTSILSVLMTSLYWVPMPARGLYCVLIGEKRNRADRQCPCRYRCSHRLQRCPRWGWLVQLEGRGAAIGGMLSTAMAPPKPPKPPNPPTWPVPATGRPGRSVSWRWCDGASVCTAKSTTIRAILSGRMIARSCTLNWCGFPFCFRSRTKFRSASSVELYILTQRLQKCIS